MSEFSYLNNANPDYIDSLYSDFCNNPIQLQLALSVLLLEGNMHEELVTEQLTLALPGRTRDRHNACRACVRAGLYV